MRRRAPAEPTGIRALLVAKYRHLAVRYDLPGWPPTAWLALVDRLERGDPVTLARWQVHRMAPLSTSVVWVRIETDGTVTPVDGPDR